MSCDENALSNRLNAVRDERNVKRYKLYTIDHKIGHEERGRAFHIKPPNSSLSDPQGRCVKFAMERIKSSSIQGTAKQARSNSRSQTRIAGSGRVHSHLIIDYILGKEEDSRHGD